MNDDVKKAVGCGDNSCMFRAVRPNGGMATNGGCRCLKDLRNWNSHNGVWNDAEVARVRNGIFELKSELSKARRERDDALAALRHVRSVIPHGLPGSLYAVARDLADAVLEDHKDGAHE